MVSLDARLAALTGLDAGELLFFAVKLLDLPAEAGRFLHGLGGELRGVVGDHIIRTLGGKRQAEQFQLMPLIANIRRLAEMRTGISPIKNKSHPTILE